MKTPITPRISYLNRGTRDWHRKPPRNEVHPQIKITVVKTGQGAIESTTQCHFLHAGMAVITPPYLWHSFCGPSIEVDVLIASFLNLSEPWYSRLFPLPTLQFFKLDATALQTVDYLHRCCETERSTGAPLSEEIAVTALLSILGILLRSRSPLPAHDASTRLLSLHESIAGRLNETIKVRDLARELGISESALRRRYQAEFGTSPKAAIDLLRLQHAQNLLTKSDLKMHAVAQACGFANEFAFGKFFYQRMGIAPASWRALPHEERWKRRVFDK